MKKREFDRVVSKLDLRVRETHHRLAWFEHDGKVITRTRRSRGSGDLPASSSIRQQLKLSDDQLRQLIACKLDRADYVEILHEKGLL
jgi:hypothetical protein